MSQRFRNAVPVLALALLIVLAVAAAPLRAQSDDRYLDRAPDRDRETRLVVFHPEVFNIRALAAIRTSGLLGVDGVVVVGVYHVKERANYAAAREFARSQGYEWMKFHAVSAPIGAADVFAANACTPEFQAIARKADGIVFFGGDDIPPALFRRPTNLMTEVDDPVRHYFEVSAVHQLLGDGEPGAAKPLLADDPGFPILGICLGFQTLVVGTGGTLVQDIPTEVYGKRTVEDVMAMGPEQWHTNPHAKLHPGEGLMGYNFHSLDLNRKGKFCREMGFQASDHPRILSSHHQAADVLGAGLVPAATSRDGRVVEAIEHERYPNVLGVQFHPEHPMLWDNAATFRSTPTDTPFSLRSLLEATPPSLEFNKRIWGWLGKKLKSHR